MNLDRLIRTAIAPALAELAPLGVQDTRRARRMLVAIALQESRATHRRQILAGGRPVGPAMGYWQFEKGGGCVGVLTHRATAERMRIVCEQYDIAPAPEALWEAIRYQDIVAATAARLLLWTLPSALPMDADEGWRQYLDAWRPGKPHIHTWANYWNTADEATQED